MTVIAFTGTLKGMSFSQLCDLETVLIELMPTVAHHGDAVGADEQFHALVRELYPECRIEVHPGIQLQFKPRRAHCAGDVIHEPLEFMARNDVMIAASAHMIGAPQGPWHPKCRHGSCATMRHAQAAGLKIHHLER